MALSPEEIARDIMVAALSNSNGCPNGDWIATQFKAVLEGVGQATREEAERHKKHYAGR